MKITRLQIQNFLGVRSVDIELLEPVTLLAGRNFAGKSSVQEAVRMALTGETVRVELKKDYGTLVTEGQETGFVEISTDAGDFSVVLPSGKGIHSDSHSLSYVLNAQRFASLGGVERRVFLFGLMGLRADGDAVTQRMLARKCDAKKVELIAPFLRAGFDAGQKEAQAKARECKAQWKTATGGETYGTVKAASFKVEKQEVDIAALEQERADLVQIEQEIEEGSTRLGELRGRAKQSAEQSGKLTDLREKASRYARIQDKLNRDEAALNEWTAKVEALRGSQASQEAIPCPDCGVMLILKDSTLVHTDPLAKGTDDDLAKLPEYEKALRLLQSAVANGKRDLAEANAAAEAIRQIEDGTIAAPSTDEIAALSTRIETLKHGRGNQQAAIRLLEEAERRATEADKRTAVAAQHHADVQSWEAIADALAPDGIPGEMVAEALGPLNERLTESADVSEWADVTVTRDMQVLAGGRPYALLSESEKWRVDAMIAEAIAHLSGLKLLVLDRFDVLDLKGREDLLIWLDILAQDGDIDTTLIFGTLKGLPSRLPSCVNAYWIENGVVAQLKEAA